MANADAEVLAKLQAVLTALLKHELELSLGNVEAALDRWRAEEIGPFEAHAEVLRHAARSERVATRIAEVQPAAAHGVMRDAFDAGLLDREAFVAMAGKAPEEVEPAHLLDDRAASATPDKRTFVEQLMGEGPVLIHIDARQEGVEVPARFRGDPKLVLRFGYGLSPAIADLEVGLESLSGTLTFGGAPFHCVLPWSAVYAAVVEGEQRGMVWPDDVPEAVLQQAAPSSSASKPEGAAAEPPREAAPEKKPRGSHLKLVE